MKRYRRQTLGFPKRPLQRNVVFTEHILAQLNAIVEVYHLRTSNASLMPLELKHINCFGGLSYAYLHL